MLTVEPIDIVSALRCTWISLVLQNDISADISQSNFTVTKAVIARFKLPKFNIKWTFPSTSRLDISAEHAEWRVGFTAIPERLTNDWDTIEDAAPVSITKWQGWCLQNAKKNDEASHSTFCTTDNGLFDKLDCSWVSVLSLWLGQQ